MKVEFFTKGTFSLTPKVPLLVLIVVRLVKSLHPFLFFSVLIEIFKTFPVNIIKGPQLSPPEVSNLL